MAQPREDEMKQMVEGMRINLKRNGTFEAEVFMNGEVVWSRPGLPTREQAQLEADRQLEWLKP
jgi:hypothetical protein